jgi:hypothetical protein
MKQSRNTNDSLDSLKQQLQKQKNDHDNAEQTKTKTQIRSGTGCIEQRARSIECLVSGKLHRDRHRVALKESKQNIKIEYQQLPIEIAVPGVDLCVSFTEIIANEH